MSLIESNKINHNEDLYRIRYLLENNNNSKPSSIEQKEDIDSLFYYFNNKENIYNKKGTKLKTKDIYLNLIKVLSEYLNLNQEYVFMLFPKININIFEVILNGYLINNYTNDEKDIIENFIKKIVPLFFDKSIFFFVYNKFSKIFRRFSIIDDKNQLFEKFLKLMNIWEIIYTVEDREKVNSSYIGFINDNSVILDLTKFKKKSKINLININIEFPQFFREKENYKIDKFCFIKAHFNNEQANEIKLEDIQNENDEPIKRIQFKIMKNCIGYYINEYCDFNSYSPKEIKISLLDNKIEKFEIMKNYIGEIKSIQISIELKKSNSKLEYEFLINENTKEKNCYKINNISETNDKDDENINIYLSQNDTNYLFYKRPKEIFYEDVRYYGGMECFIPILKIVNYLIKINIIDSKKIIILIDYLKKIIKIILKFICLSKNNFLNFKDIFVPLLGALGEINHSLPIEYQKDLYNDHIFSSLYILIISASIPLAHKKAYILITGLDDINKLNIIFDDFIINIDSLDTKCFGWYSIILYIYIEFILLVYGDYCKIHEKIFEQLKSLYSVSIKCLEEITEINSLIKLLIGSLKYICEDEKGDINNILHFFLKVDNFSQFLENESDIFDNIIYYVDNINIIMKVFFNLIDFDFIIKNELVNENIETHVGKKINSKTPFKFKFIQLFKSLNEILSKENNSQDKIKAHIINSLKDFIHQKELICECISVIKDNDFELESEIIIKELTDYHRAYHKLMKNIFIYNRMWSDKKLYFTEKKRLLKYKYINYYTSNFQRPLLFPINDYKYSYPSFSKFQIGKDFYLEKENQDDYNFTLDCPELDEFSFKYEQTIFQKMEKELQMYIQNYNVCLVKREYHVKGKLYVLNNNGLITKFFFFGFPYEIAKNTPSCNASDDIQHVNLKKEKLCFGETFLCPKRSMNIKIVIDIVNVRLMLRRIYFYRKTGIEIFTKTKSYYFNFAEDLNCPDSKIGEMNCEIIIQLMAYYSKTELFPITIKNQLIGYSREFCQIVKLYDEQEKNLIEKENKFISVLFDHYKPSQTKKEYSSLDMIISLNLLSNRSYIDLFQYLVFPTLFLYEKNNEDNNNSYKLIQRELNKHIGFQEASKKLKNRNDLIKRTYAETIKENEEQYFDDEDEEEVVHYFNTHYSNNVYTCNYLIRFFPYSFIAIEIQGNGFDTPNRLFFSIERTFYNISTHKSDIRELIPEFYYFPEMFMNINKLNFGKKIDGELVNDVQMPFDLNFNNEINNNININQEEENSNDFRCFKFVEAMRNLLESKVNSINSWIDIIFGVKNKYKSNKKQDQYFRTESYIDFSKDKEKEFDQYLKNKIIMESFDFGISPVQTLFEQKDIFNFNFEKRKIIYQKKIKENKELYQNLCNKFIDAINELKEDNTNDKIIKKVKRKSNNENINQVAFFSRFNEMTNIKIKKSNNKGFSSSKIIITYNLEKEKLKLNGYKTGRVDIFIDNNLYDVLYDHNDEITFINYNKRLNMFCTTSKDGFLCVYMFPNKLITTIKNPNENYFNIGFLSSNPFPCIIAFEETNYELFSYSINGFPIIKRSLFKLLDIKEKISELGFFPFFNERGGTYKDRLIIIEEITKKKLFKDQVFKGQLFTVPFFDNEEKKFEIK